jgi:hypothetical protein
VPKYIRVGIEEDIDRLRGLGDVPTRAPAPSTWWWDNRYLLLGVGMILSLGATLGISRLGATGDDELTTGAGSSTTTVAPDGAAPAAPGAKPTATTQAPANGGPASPNDPPATTTTSPPTTARPAGSGPTPVTVGAGSNPNPPTTPTTAAGPPWRSSSISVFPPATIVAGEAVDFGVSVRGVGDVYQLAFGDGSSTGSAATFGCDDYSFVSSYRHTFASPGRYTLTVRIHGSGSCTTLPRDWRTTTKTLTFDVVAPS